METQAFYTKLNCQNYITSARIKMPKYRIHAKIKKCIPPLFMTFLDVIEVPEHDKAIKILVSVWKINSILCLIFFDSFVLFMSMHFKSQKLDIILK
jgi:hypothetical protein